MALLELRAVSKRFGEVVAAEDVSFAVGEGETVGVVGPNGAGKSTLFAIMSGDVAPTRGRVLFDDRDVTRLGAAARCRLGIGRTYQVPRPFEGMSVFENVLIAAHQGAAARGRAAHALAVDVLERTRLTEQANRPAAQLGLLARKRLEMARALATRPRLLLLDEVAGGLTELEVAEVVALVRRANEDGIAVIWIEHVVRALVASVGRLVCLAFGQLLADGRPAEVLADPAVREVYLGVVAPTVEDAAVP